jgi:diacylglycerol O-acyltransferase
MSYDGHLGFGLLGDFDALPDLEDIAADLKWAIASLARAAGVGPTAKRRTKKAATPRKAKAPAAKRASAR